MKENEQSDSTDTFKHRKDVLEQVLQESKSAVQPTPDTFENRVKVLEKLLSPPQQKKEK